MNSKKTQKPRDPAINVRVPPELKAELKKFCKETGLKQSWVIKTAIAELIRKK